MIKSAFSVILGVAGTLLCAGYSTVEKNGEEGVAYRARMSGADDRAVRGAVKDSTATWKLKKILPHTVGQLSYRMERDMVNIQSIMESHGYYDGEVSMELDAKRAPARAAFLLDLGEQYRFRNFDLVFLGDADAVFSSVNPRIRSEQRMTATAVMDEQQRILDWLTRQGYPFPKLVRRAVNVDRTQKVVDVELVIDPGAKAFFSETMVEGLDELPDTFIHRQLPWKPGDRYDVKEVSDFERTLLESGLFKSVRVEPQEPAAMTNAIPVTVRVSERAKRTIRFGVSYSDIGPEGRIYWEHRNLFGSGERLETSLTWSPIEVLGSVTLTRYGFLRANQSLVLNLEVADESPDAYDAKKVRGRGMVFRDFSSQVQAGAGIGAKHARVEQFDSKEYYNYLIFPLQATYDSSNDRLNPVRGQRIFAYTSLYDELTGGKSFFKSAVEGRHYAMLWTRYRLSSALRLTLGSIDGAAVESVAADERFYAGGGGSIRGYEYQSVGQQINGDPVGGDKLLEFSTELRLRPGKRFGYVAFIDGGTVYNERFDDYNRSLRYGAGVGLRWFSTIGPLRVDFAYPLNPDSNHKERLQFYISLGQAF
jgi:translocation and assembly module TamA